MNVDNKLLTAMKAKDAKVIDVPGIPEGVIEINDNILQEKINVAPTYATEGVINSADVIDGQSKAPIYEMHDPAVNVLPLDAANQIKLDDNLNQNDKLVNNFNYEQIEQKEPIDIIKLDYATTNNNYMERLPEQLEIIKSDIIFKDQNILENNNFNDNNLRMQNIQIYPNSGCESCDASSLSEIKSEGIADLNIEVTIKKSNDGNF